MPQKKNSENTLKKDEKIAHVLSSTGVYVKVFSHAWYVFQERIA